MMMVLGRGLVFQPVLVTQTCSYNNNNIITLQNIDITDFPRTYQQGARGGQEWGKRKGRSRLRKGRRTKKRRKSRARCCFVLLVGCLSSQQHASVSQGRICTDNFTCCHTEIEAADQTFHLTQSQYTDTGPTSPSADPITPGAWQGSHWSANF